MEGSSASAEVTRVASASSLGSEGGSRAVKVIPLQHPAEPSPLSQSADVYGRWGAKVRGMSAMDWLELLLPCTRWMRKYRIKEYLQADLMAGITVGVMLVPQSMSYAKLAGLHPIYGLYGGFVPVFVYAIFGSSRQLAVGPVALTSLLVSNVLTPIVDPSDKLYTELAILMSLMVGVFESLMGLLRLGWLIRFVNHSVISGFTTASAIVIALSQLKYFLGYPIVLSSKIIPLVKSIIAGAGKFSWPPFVMGSIFLVILLVMKHMGKTNKKFRSVRAAGPLTPVIVGTIFVKIFHPHSISVVGDIPQGLPKFSIPRGFENVMSLIPTALLITGVAILESVGIAKALAVKNGYDLDSNQELFGLGVANICGSFFSSYPSTGSFSRSAVNNESGAQTGLSGIVMGIIMSCALLFMTPLFTEIPQCALAAIVISAVMGLVGFSLAFVIYESANPHIAVTHIDSSAIQTLKDLHQEYKSRGIQIAIANPNQGVHLLLSRSRVIELIGVEWFFVRVHDAVQVCLQHVQNMNPSTPKVSDNTNYTNSDPKRQSSFVESLWKRKPNVATPAEEPLLLHNEVV
ncbi:hypothetical protein ZIOFF_008558 [Zingiber officinale]|uniref:STAS domain-containing protein n=1 Tax=Zingiber officinale TaxID=94328 RepID=A0A8J5LQV0_ZINOF|nr:hypothetical protein ZIOFF_008558 [Zingiber officinale]